MGSVGEPTVPLHAPKKKGEAPEMGDRFQPRHRRDVQRPRMDTTCVEGRPSRSPRSILKSTTTRCRLSRVLGVLAFVAVAVGIVPEAAQAKEVRSVVVCGVGGCRSVDGNQRFLDLFNIYLPPTHRPDRVDRAHWFRVRVKITVPGTTLPPETWRTRFYPAAGVIHDRGDGWRRIPKSSLAAYQHAVAKMVPFGAPSRAALPRQTRDPVLSKGETSNAVPVVAIVAVGSLAVACAGIGVWRLGRRRGVKTPEALLPPL